MFNRNKPAPAPVDPSINRANQSPTGAIPGDPRASSAQLGDRAAAVPVEDAKPTIPLPTGPIEPYMITKENGPFMVRTAYSFRGPL